MIASVHRHMPGTEVIGYDNLNFSRFALSLYPGPAEVAIRPLPDRVVIKAPNPTVESIGLNLGKPVFQDKAVRQAIEQKFPRLAEIHLVNYSVRILDENRGTAAVTRVLLDSSDGVDSWGSVGVNENVVEASWQALVDSINYGLLRGES